jgi:predicted lipid-binding transport protein (Tim44 family)
MSDPKRWRETETKEIAMLLDELSKVEPTAEVRESVWTKIAPTLPPGPGPTSPPDGTGGGRGGGGGAGPATGGLAAKVIGPAIVALGASAVAIWMATRPAPAPPSAVPTSDVPVVTASAMNQVSAEPSAAPLPAAEVPTEPPAIATSAPRMHAAPKLFVAPAPSASAVSAADRLREEAEGVRKVRLLLREKNAPAALAELDRLAKLVPNGPLEEEREVLTIEALASAGNTDAARRRAERFLFERPTSVHAARVRAASGR